MPTGSRLRAQTCETVSTGNTHNGAMKRTPGIYKTVTPVAKWITTLADNTTNREITLVAIYRTHTLVEI